MQSQIERNYQTLMEDIEKYSTEPMTWKTAERLCVCYGALKALCLMGELDDFNTENTFPTGEAERLPNQRKVHLSQKTAAQWVDGLEGLDGMRGGKWTMEEVKPLLNKKGIPEDKQSAYWAVMNSLYSDYSAVLKKLNASTADVYFELAKAFIDDPDAVPDKVEQYFEHIVKH